MDSPSTQDEGMSDSYSKSDSAETDIFSIDSIDFGECQDRIIQVSVPDYQGHLFSAIRAARKNEALTDASLVVREKTFHIHRLIISAFSNTLRKFFSKESMRVVVITDIDPDIMSCILDFIYENMAIVKESMLSKFLKAAKQLEIEQLQTPELLKLEQNWLAQKKCPDSNIGTKTSSDQTHCLQILEQNLLTMTNWPNSNTEKSSDVKKDDIAAMKLCLPSSVSITTLDNNASKISKNEFISEMEGDQICKDNDEAKVCNENLNKINEERKTHCCCCKKLCERSKKKKKEAVKENDGESESLKKKLKKCGTVISSLGINNLLDIPERLLSSSDISLTPIKLPSKVSTPKESIYLNNKIATPISPLPDSGAVKVDSIKSKFSAINVRRNLQNSFHTQIYRQKQVASGSSSNNRGYDSGGIIGSKRGPLLAGLRGPMPLGFKGAGRKYVSFQIQERTPCPAVRHNFNYTPKSQNICMQENVSSKRIDSGQSRGRLDTNKMIQSVGRGGINKLLQSVGRVGIYSMIQDPTVQTDIGKDRALHSEAENTPAEKAGYSPVNIISEPRCGTLENTVFRNGKEPLNFDDSGNNVQTSDNATELIQDSFCLKSGVDLNNLANLEFENSQLHGQIIVTGSQNPHLAVESFRSQDLQKSENTNKTIFPLPQEQSSSPSCEHQATIMIIPTDLEVEPLEVNDDLVDLTKKLPTSQPVHKLEKIDKTGASEGGGDLGEDLSINKTVMPSISNSDTQQPDNTDKQDLPVKPSKMRKQRKRLGRPKNVQRCIICQKTFSSHSVLIMHMRIHSGENPFHCTSCDYHTELFNGIKNHAFLKHKRSLKESESIRHYAQVVSEKPAKINKIYHLDDKRKNDDQSLEIDGKI